MLDVLDTTKFVMLTPIAVTLHMYVEHMDQVMAGAFHVMPRDQAILRSIGISRRTVLYNTKPMNIKGLVKLFRCHRQAVGECQALLTLIMINVCTSVVKYI